MELVTVKEHHLVAPKQYWMTLQAYQYLKVLVANRSGGRVEATDLSTALPVEVRSENVEWCERR